MKLRATVTVEYEPNEEHYPGAKTAGEMAAIDQENWSTDLIAFVCSFEDDQYVVAVTPA